jgi:hypothetical protein
MISGARKFYERYRYFENGQATVGELRVTVLALPFPASEYEPFHAMGGLNL